jgi:hypothetical protein
MALAQNANAEKSHHPRPTRNREQHHRDRRAERSRRCQPIGAQFRFQPAQGEGAAYGAYSDDTQYYAVELRSPGDLLARNERKQGPIGGREQQKGRTPDDRGLQMRIVLGMPKPGANGATELLDRQVPPPPLRWTPAKQHSHHAEIAHRIDPERYGKAESGKDHAAQGRADCSADIDADAVRCDRTL